MRRMVFLGNSPVLTAAIERIRSTDSDAEIVLLPAEKNLPYKREFLTSFLRGEKKLKDVLVRPEEFYKAKNVRVVDDKKILRINFHRKQIVLEDKEIVEFDQLAVAGTPDVVFPEMKGTKKVGVLAADRLDDVEKIANLVSFLDSALIQSDSPVGDEVAAILAEKGKEVILLKPSAQQVLPEETTEETPAETKNEDEPLEAERQSEEEEDRLRVFHGIKIAEILGDSDAKAVRLTNGKVYASDMVIFTETTPNLRLFYDSSIEINDRIRVKDNLKTSLEHVFAVGEVGEPFNRESSVLEDSAEALGVRLADSMLGLLQESAQNAAAPEGDTEAGGENESQSIENNEVAEISSNGSNG